MTLLAKTTKQLKREQRDRLVAAEFLSYRKAYPDAPARQIVRTIAQAGKFDLSEPGIVRVLYKTGAMTAKKRS